jgi:hypothetical protein
MQKRRPIGRVASEGPVARVIRIDLGCRHDGNLAVNAGGELAICLEMTLKASSKMNYELFQQLI